MCGQVVIGGAARDVLTKEAPDLVTGLVSGEAVELLDIAKKRVEDITSFQKKLNLAKPLTQISALSDAYNLDPQKLYQAEKASLARGGAEEDIPNFWKNLHQKLTHKPDEIAQAKQFLPPNIQFQNTQGDLNENLFSDIQEAYRQGEISKNNLINALEGLGANPDSGVYKMITNNMPVSEQLRAFEKETPDQKIFFHVKKKLPAFAQEKARDDLGELKDKFPFEGKTPNSFSSIGERITAGQMLHEGAFLNPKVFQAATELLNDSYKSDPDVDIDENIHPERANLNAEVQKFFPQDLMQRVILANKKPENAAPVPQMPTVPSLFPDSLPHLAPPVQDMYRVSQQITSAQAQGRGPGNSSSQNNSGYGCAPNVPTQVKFGDIIVNNPETDDPFDFAERVVEVMTQEVQKLSASLSPFF